MKDILITAFPNDNKCLALANTDEGTAFMLNQYEPTERTFPASVNMRGTDVNEFMNKLREIGLSFTFRSI